MSQQDSEPKPGPLPAGDRVIAIGRATLRNVDFRKARFDRFALDGCLFLTCDFRGVTLDRRWQSLFSADPRNIFRDCNFEGADLRRVRPDQARFERCLFDDALLDGWRSEAAEFVGCRFAGALGAVTFFGRPAGNAAQRVKRKKNEFAGNDFQDADLERVTFTRGIDLDLQRLPLSDELVRLDQFARRIAFARVEVLRWEVQAERIAAIDFLKALTMRFRDQRDVIVPRVAKDGPSSRVQVRVWAVLERAFEVKL